MINGFFDTVLNIVSSAGQYIYEAQQNNVPVVNSYNIPYPQNGDAFDFNRYSNDLREQTPQYQAAQLQQIKNIQTINLCVAVAGGIIIGGLLFK